MILIIQNTIFCIFFDKLFFVGAGTFSLIFMIELSFLIFFWFGVQTLKGSYLVFGFFECFPQQSSRKNCPSDSQISIFVIWGVSHILCCWNWLNISEFKEIVRFLIMFVSPQMKVMEFPKIFRICGRVSSQFFVEWKKLFFQQSTDLALKVCFWSKIISVSNKNFEVQKKLFSNKNQKISKIPKKSQLASSFGY